MSDRKEGAAMPGRFRKFIQSCLAAVTFLVAAGTLYALPGTDKAQADAIYFNGASIGFGFGTGGYRGGLFYGPLGFSGPPFLPYGPPYYYHPYDRRAYPYRSRVYVNPPRYYAPRYNAPRYYPAQPQRVPYTKTELAPFTPQWAAYCSRKYRSFNPNTGTYLAYSGKYRFCR